MKIFTSYYKYIEMNPHGLVPVQISTSAPKWFPYYLEKLPELYPGWDIVTLYKKGELTEEMYKKKYFDKLSLLRKEEILEKLKVFSIENGNRDIVLLCYERPEDFCHRHIVAEWLGGVYELR